MILTKTSLSCDRSFIVLATVIMIVKYDHKTFTVQATGARVVNIGVHKTFSKLPSTNIRAGEQGSRVAGERYHKSNHDFYVISV